MNWLELSIDSVQKAVKIMNVPKPARLYLPVLPENIEDDKAYAVCDNPYMQRYEKLRFDAGKMGHTLIIGRSGSGKSELLHTILERSDGNCSVYIIDHGGGRLKDQSDRTYCGGYISEEDNEDIERLMIFIEEMITVARKHSEKTVVGTMSVLLVFDGFGSIENSSEEFRDRITRILNMGRSASVTVVAASCEVPSGKISRLFETFLFLGDEDPYTVSQYLKVSPRDVPVIQYRPGRGVGLIDGVPLEFQTVKGGVHLGNSPPGGIRAAKFPSVPKPATLEVMIKTAIADADGARSLPAGYEVKSGKIYTLPMQTANCILIFGRTYSGRHTLLSNISVTAARYGIACVYVQSYEAFISALRKPERRIIVTVESITRILDDFYKETRSEKEEEELAGYLTNPFTANRREKDGKLIVGLIDNEAKMRFAGRRVFEEMCMHIYGISLGGKLDENRIFDYSYLPYSQMQKSQSRGYATILKYDENHFFGDVIIPVEI